MNYSIMRYVISRIMISESLLMLLPLGVALINGEKTAALSFVISILLTAAIGLVLGIRADRNGDIYAKDGLIIVALAWIVMSVFGALPLFISGTVSSFTDAFFEIVSGFTTTGASILTDIEAVDRGILFWRSFTHWIGGMGVLVFVMAIMPLSNGQSMHFLRAEVPGPTVGKLVSKLSDTAKILYAIYFVLTLIETALLLAGGMSLFDSLIHSFGSAGTGGFSDRNLSVGYYNSAYFDTVIGIFMMLFGINFNLYYFILLKKFREVFRSEELRAYLGIITVATVGIAINLLRVYDNFAKCLRFSFFQVSSIITTTGFSTVDFNQWPTFSKTILVILMFLGACAGSTGGGIKIARIVLLVKTSVRNMRRMLHPHAVKPVRFEGKPIDEATIISTYVYFSVYMIIFTLSVLLLSLDHFDLITTFTAVASCLNNIGPGLEIVGPMGNFSSVSTLGKLLLSFDMLVGRLEVFPVLMLFAPSCWKRSAGKLLK